MIMCACKNNNNLNSSVAPITNTTCETEYSFLLNLLNSIEVQYQKPNSLETLQALNNYKGQIMSGINLGDYCYFNYNLIKTLIDEIIIRSY